MNIDNITSDSMTLTYNGKAMLIKVYEQEIERLKEQLNDEIDDELKQSEIMVKKQEEIKRLKEEYVMLQNASDEVEEEKDKEIARLTAESTKWESKFYDEAKKVDKAIEYMERYMFSQKENYDYIHLLDILKRK